MTDYDTIIGKIENYMNGDFSLEKEVLRYDILEPQIKAYIDKKNLTVVLTIDGAINVLRMFIEDKITLEQLHRWALFKLGNDYLEYEDNIANLPGYLDKYEDIPGLDEIVELVTRLDWIGEEELMGEFTKKDAKEHIDRLIKSKEILEKLKKSDQK